MSYFTFESSGLPASAKVASFRGEEAISSLYGFEVHLVVPDDDCASMDLGDSVGARGTLLIRRSPDDEPHPIHGILADVELVHAAEGKALLRVTLVPELWTFAATRHSRMFTDRKVPDVLKAVLEDGGLRGDAYAFELSGKGGVEEHVCQYKESDYDFLSRWMAREGMYFYFDHAGDREKLVITDDRGTHARSPEDPVRYHPVHAVDVTAKASFRTFEARAQALPARTVYRDYNYGNPSLDVSGEASVSDAGLDDVVIHGARFFTPDDGARLARLGAEARIAEKSVFEGSGTVYGLRPGYTFGVEDHPDPAMSRAYLATRVRHEGRQAGLSAEFAKLVGIDMPEGYRVFVTAIPDDVQLRVRAAAPWPRVAGFEAGVVDSAGGGPYGPLDDAGRYAVKLHFDESGLGGGKATTWVRMMQPHAGSPEGFHFPLRTGTEVMIAFLAGDPDRPVIAGAVPNATTPSKVTAANNTKNVIHTGSDNRLEIEDLAGKQYFDLSTPPQDTRIHLGQPHAGHTHYITEHTNGDCLFEIGSNQDINVGGTLTEKVTGAVDETYSSIQFSQVKGPQKTKATGPVQETYESLKFTSVTGAVTEKYMNHQESDVTGPKIEIYSATQTTSVTDETKETFTGVHLKSAGPTTQTHTGTMSTRVTGPVIQSYGGNVNLNYGPTKKDYASLLWIIPGGGKLDAPNWKVVTPDETWLFSKEEIAWAKKWEWTGTQRSFTTMKIELVGGSAAFTGFKNEAHEINIGLKTAKANENAAIEIELGVVYIELAGLVVKA
jgi:type VI secretion system secreted protein VgrG